MTKNIQSVDIYGEEFTVPVDELYWRPSAYGIVIQDDNVLLVPQFEENRYDLPGGSLDIGELLEEGVIREVKEETGLTVANPQLVTGTSNFFTFTHAGGRTAECIMLYYKCDLVGGTISTEGFDEHEKVYAKQAVWFPISNLGSIFLASTFDWRDAVRQTAK